MCNLSRFQVRQSVLTSLVALICTFLQPGTVVAGGPALTEIGNLGVGRAGAGWSAVAEDASTAFMNPAGMSKLSGSQWLAGIQPIYINSDFSTTDGTTETGGGGGNAGGVIPSGSFFYVYDPEENARWKFGVSFASIVGLGLDYDDSWAGRYYADEISLLTAGLTFNGSYEVTDWLSVGTGVGPIVAQLKQSAFVNNVLDRLPDGKIELEDEALALSAYVGILVEPFEGTRLGVTYYAPSEFDFEDVARIDGAGPLLTAALDRTGINGSNVDLELTVPQILMISGYHEFSDEVTIMGNFGFQDWSEFGELGVGIVSEDTRSFEIESDYRDTRHFAIGLDYEFDPDWAASLGFAYDTSAVSKANRTPAFVVDRQVRYSAGIRCDLTESTTLGVSYTLIDLGDAEVCLIASIPVQRQPS